MLAAVVEKIGKHPGVSSGYFVVYQLVKYKVVAVCVGNYDQQEIIVDHLLVSGDEVSSLHIGNRVYLTLVPSKAIELRYNEEGIRSPSDNVPTFYIGHEPEVIKPAQCK